MNAYETVTQVRYSLNDRIDDPTPPLPTPAEQPEGPPAVLSLSDHVGMTVERNPRLAQVGWAVESARGLAVQAGLYPNTAVSFTGYELGDKTGPGGIWTTPPASQEIVTANKLGLSQTAALKEVDQATLGVIAERYRLFTEVGQNFFDLVVLQRRIAGYTELVGLADQSVTNPAKLPKAKEVSELDVVHLEVELERYRADLTANQKMVPAVYRQLVSSVGVQDMAFAQVVGDLETGLPNYDLQRLRVYVLGIHPEIRAAQIGFERAQFVLKSLSAGYPRQNQNKSSDWDVGLGLPVPLWNRNQGNIRAAKAQVDIAINEVVRVENDLVNRLSAAYAAYISAQKLAERYKSTILPKAELSYRLSMKAYQGGQFEYLRVLQAQRAVAQSRLEFLASLRNMWRAASQIAGLMLEDNWPLGNTPGNPLVQPEGIPPEANPLQGNQPRENRAAEKQPLEK